MTGSTDYLVNEKDYTEFIKNGRKIIIFTTSWCKSAIMMSMIFEKMAIKYQRFLNFAKIDVDVYKEIVTHAKVGAVPEFIIYKDGELISRKHITREIDLEDFIIKFRERENYEDESDDY